MTTLGSVLDRLGVPRYERELWFRGARLEGAVLQVADADAAGVILRCYAERIRALVPLERVVVQAAPPPAKKPGAFKGSYTPAPTKLLDF